MGLPNGVDETEDTGARFQGSRKSTGFTNLKDTLADTLHRVAEALGEKAAAKEEQCAMAQYGKQASEWLAQSAEDVRQFNSEQANARVRAYVKQSPGRSLLIAGAVGLVIGALLRRR